jgi:glycosyltransferase involved in cell wall biosynthesis
MDRFLAPPCGEPRETGGPPDFSVVIPTYESAGTIAEAVASALDQTYPAREVIVVDDGSRDGTAAALEPFMERILFIRQENAGVSSARNTGLSRASGDFIVNLDADDLLDPRSLEARAELLAERPDLDIVCTNGHVTLDGEIVRERYFPDWTFEIDDQRTEILRRCFIHFWSVRRSRLLEVGGFDPRISHAQDWDCWIRLIGSGSRAGLVDEALGAYRLRDGSQTSDRVRVFEGRIAALKKVIASGTLAPEESALAAKVLADDIVLQKLTRAREALLTGSPHRRRELRCLAIDREVPALSRLRASVAWVSPGLAHRILARRGHEIAGGVMTLPGA